VIGPSQAHVVSEHRYREDTDVDYAHATSGVRVVDDYVS
jgi:hypothetical protein